MLDPTSAGADLVTKRIDICRACPNIKITTVPFINKDVEVCGLCSCPLKTKTYFKNSRCPAKEPKW
jgi:hypothetical protein